MRPPNDRASVIRGRRPIRPEVVRSLQPVRDAAQEQHGGERNGDHAEYPSQAGRPADASGEPRKRHPARESDREQNSEHRSGV